MQSSINSSVGLLRVKRKSSRIRILNASLLGVISNKSTVVVDES